MSNQNLNRVKNRIGDSIIAFFNFKKATGDELFYVEDLRHFVQATGGFSAPASPDRILRHLRSEGELDYIVLDRSLSLYQIL